MGSRLAHTCKFISTKERTLSPMYLNDCVNYLKWKRNQTTLLHPLPDIVGGKVYSKHPEQTLSFSLFFSGIINIGTRGYPVPVGISQWSPWDSGVHETPEMLFNRELHLSCDFLFGHPPYESLSSEEYIRDLLARFEDIHNFVLQRTRITTKKMKTRYNTKVTEHEFNKGDKVWLWNPFQRKGLSSKLLSNCNSPYTILKKTEWCCVSKKISFFETEG